MCSHHDEIRVSNRYSHTLRNDKRVRVAWMEQQRRASADPAWITPRFIRATFLALALLLGLASPLYAVDGVIEINQTRALAGGVTPGDTPGFPVTISQPGSYRLTGNLDVTNPGVDAIEITTDNVTLDLNGFVIRGPDGGSGRGIDAQDKNNITVANGTVQDMGGIGVYLGADAHVERVRAISNGLIGIAVGAGSTVSGNIAQSHGDIGINAGNGSTVSGNTAQNNSVIGINASNGSTVSGNTAQNNSGIGIGAGNGSTVSGNTAQNNSGIGINAGNGSTVSGNTAKDNGGFGLNPGLSGYANNVFNGNNGGNANPQVNGGIEIGTNVCGTNTTCP